MMTKSERRAAMPQVTAWLDDIREHFGEPVGIRAQENGHTVEWGTLKDGELARALMSRGRVK